MGLTVRPATLQEFLSWGGVCVKVAGDSVQRKVLAGGPGERATVWQGGLEALVAEAGSEGVRQPPPRADPGCDPGVGSGAGLNSVVLDPWGMQRSSPKGQWERTEGAPVWAQGRGSLIIGIKVPHFLTTWQQRQGELEDEGEEAAWSGASWPTQETASAEGRARLRSVQGRECRGAGCQGGTGCLPTWAKSGQTAVQQLSSFGSLLKTRVQVPRLWATDAAATDSHTPALCT